MTAGVSEEAWGAVAEEYQRILAHPFVVRLGDGTLDRPVFERYLRDDAHYLLEYARALVDIASRMPSAEGVGVLARCAAGAVEAERELHRSLLGDGVDLGAGNASPGCRAYTGFLREQAAGAPIEVALGAVLPCFRVYAEVGAALQERSAGVVGHPYAPWIATYADPEFVDVVHTVERLTDAATEESAHRADVVAAYRRATRYEWEFWDQSWRGW